MKMRWMFFLFAYVLPASVPAQPDKAKVIGKILDQQRKPVEFAAVTLLNANDTSLVKGTLSADDGSFSIEQVPAGKYFLAAEMNSYPKKWSAVFDLADGQSYDAGELLFDNVKVNDEVVIAATLPLFSQKPGMLVMNVENSPVKITGTAYDVISKAPGVSVDQDGNFSLMGKSGVKIYIDGKPTYLDGEQLKNYLQNMSASEILNIELMTNPPAKYDAAGGAGIINLVTKKSTQQGFNGTVNAGLGQGFSTKTETGIALSYGQPKYSIYAKYDLANPKRKEYKFVTRTVPYQGFTSRYDQNSDLTFDPLTQRARVGADFYPTSKINFGIRLDGTSLVSKTGIDTKNTVTQVDSNTVSILHQVNSLKGNFQNAGGGIYYKQKLDTNGTELSFSYDNVFYNNSSHENYDLHFLDANGIDNATPAFERTLKGTNIGINVGQVDLTHPFAGKYKLEAGLKSSYVKTNNDLLFELQDNSTGNWSNDTTRSNSFIYKEQINAAYADLSADYGKWQLEGGLRLEQTISDGFSPTVGEEHKAHKTQLFPTLFITQKINDRNSMSYSFSKRVDRPDYEDLNPFIFYIDQYTYRLGNPYLQPEIVYDVNVMHDYSDMLFTSIDASRSFGGFADVTTQIDSTGIIHQSTVNLNTIDNLFFTVAFSYSFTNWWASEANVIVNYNHYISNVDGVSLNRGNTALDLYLTETFTVFKDWKVQVSGWYQSRMVYTIFTLGSTSDVSIGISKSFLKKKLNCSLNAGDLFYQNTQHVTVNFGTQDLYAWHEFDTRVVFLRAKYNFGNAKAARKSQFSSGADDLKDRAK
ncbi:MAG TPA: outer membrane beta-barrel family protein, partial [Bacteroidia bacterium]|jgi:hypothetical protein|nr:outer membrane beta-barrel family protein [Bacteroidia bacterium]